MKFSLLLLLLCSSTTWAFNKDFKTINDRVPLEFQLLFDSMKIEAKTPPEKIKFIALCKELDQNLGVLPKDQIFLLMKSEVIKNTLEYKFSKVRQFDMSTLLIDRLEADFAKKERYLNPFSQWIWRSILAELNFRKSRGIITAKSFIARAFEGEKLNEALRFEKYLNYLMPWVDKMDSLPSTQFNNLSKEVSWTILRRLNNRSLLFKRYASTAAGDTKIGLFNIPEKLLNVDPQDFKAFKEGPPISLKEEAELEKSKAQDEVNKVTPEDMSPVSSDIEKELEKLVD